MTTTEKNQLAEKIMNGTASLDERDWFWKLVSKGRHGEHNALHLVLAGVRALGDSSKLELVTDEALSMERAMR